MELACEIFILFVFNEHARLLINNSLIFKKLKVETRHLSMIQY